MKYVIYALRIAMFGLLGLTVWRLDLPNAVLLAATFMATAWYEWFHFKCLKDPVVTLDAKTLIEKVDALERDFAETKNKISALSMSAGIKPQVSKHPFAR